MLLLLVVSTWADFDKFDRTLSDGTIEYIDYLSSKE